MALDPITAGIDLASTIVGKIWPDKTAQEQQQLAAVLSMVQGQMAINQAEASSTDRLQHWRGGLGWVCTLSYLYHFVVHALTGGVLAIVGHRLVLPPRDVAAP